VRLTKQKAGQPKKVNKAVSFNVIKEQAFELFYSKTPTEQRLEQLTALFLTGPTVRPKRKKTRAQRELQPTNTKLLEKTEKDSVLNYREFA
jgi:hypothetical protein